ncbi:MAG: hypothetical protein II996_00100 [Oscillospiraceae bacterium]|nr:hypothetical protein [Oscillospiraceae bacterium]
MKKFLSFSLALIMIIAMLPTSFAAVGDAAAITYDFTSESRNQTERAYIERNLAAPPANFTTYPKDQTPPDADAKDQWIYLGTNMNYSGSTSSAPWVRIDYSGYLITHMGENIWPTSTVGSDTVGEGYMALQIYVPTAGTYDLSLNVEKMSVGSKNVDIYLGKATDTLNKEYFTSEAVVGTKKALTAGTDENPYTKALATTDNNRIREGAKPFSELGIPSEYLMASGVSLKQSQAATIPLTNQLTVNEPGDYLLVIHNKDTESCRLLLSGLTLTPAKLDKTHEYVFNNTVLTGDILENTAFINLYRMFYKPEGETERYSGNYLDSYDNVNKSLTDEWCVSLLGGMINSTSYKFTSSLGETRLQMVGRKRLNNGANGDANFVLKLNVKYDGIYAVTADVGEYVNGTQADIYMLPADETITGINSEMLKNYNSIGRVSNVTGEVDGDIGAVQLTTGDWYFVFAFNSTNKSTATNSRQYFNLEKITLTEIDALPETGTTPEAVEGEDIPEISFSATTSIPDKAAVTINGVEGNLSVLKPSIGDEINVSAPEVPGYKFIGWKSGSANDDGDGELANTSKFVKGLEQEDTFTVYTSTFLTAVYEELTPTEDADAVVEFWNLDGSYLGQKPVTELEELAAQGKSLKTSLIGHTFTGWFTAEDVALDIAAIVEKVTHAVAGYTADATLAATGDDGVRVNGETVSDANAYGIKVPCTDNGGTVTHWLRDGKVVSYDPTYIYYVWDSTNITSSYAPIEEKPLVVLDGDTVSGAYMIEYDKGNADAIVEVGILFGTGTPTVESKSEIFKSQRGDNHGQFAAKPSDSSYIARGYMIYEDGGEYKVIYSE